MIASDLNFYHGDHDLQDTDLESFHGIADRLTQKRLRIRIPKTLHQEPVISRLVSDYELTVNIKAAILGANANGDGWFDLELQGSTDHIASAMTYLGQVEVEIWKESEIDGW